MTDLSLKRKEVTTHSAISVVNAIPAGRGVTIGIDIPCKVRVSIGRSANSKINIKSNFRDQHNLIATSLNYAMKKIGVKLPRSSTIFISIKSKIPPAVGLKSSSAVSVAVVKAVVELFSSKLDNESILKVSSIASKDSKASLTGAYDDASACLLGGMVFTDNTRFKILRHTRVPKRLGSNVALLVPNYRKKLTSSIDRRVFSKYKEKSLRAFQYALNGEVVQAMLLNSVIQCASLRYPIRPVISAIREGATAAGVTGKGPAVSALCSNVRTLQRVTERWQEENPDCRVINTSIVQPERLIQ